MDIVRRSSNSLNLNLTPLIDVVFQLLVFFMLTSTFVSPAIELNLPQAKTQDQINQDIVMVSINKEGELWINNEQSSFETLAHDLSKNLTHQQTSSVNIKGDQDMPYHLFVQAMDLAREAGATQVNIVHEGEK